MAGPAAPKTTRAAVEDFIAQRCLALVGLSRHGKGFGHAAWRALRQKGYRVLPVHPEVEAIAGERCYPDLASLPEPVGGVLVVVPPVQSERVLIAAAAAGIPRVWLQQGAESAAAIRLGAELGLSVIAGECIMMFAAPVRFPHSLHRWFRGKRLPR